MTAADVLSAYALLQSLQQLRQRMDAFDGAQTYQVTALGADGSVIGAVPFPAAAYKSAVDQAFSAEIATVAGQLDALGVTGY